MKANLERKKKQRDSDINEVPELTPADLEIPSSAMELAISVSGQCVDTIGQYTHYHTYEYPVDCTSAGDALWNWPGQVHAEYIP